MSYLEKLLATNPTLKLKNGFVKKKGQSIFFYYSKKLVEKNNDKIPLVAFDFLYFLSFKIIFYTFLVSQYNQISQQTTLLPLIDKNFQKILLKLPHFNLHSLQLKKRSLGFLILIFLINDLVLILQGLKVLHFESLLKSRKIKLGVIGVFFLLLITNLSLKKKNKIKSLKIIKQNFLIFLMLIYFNFILFFFKLVPKINSIEQNTLNNLGITKILKKHEIKIITVQVNLRVTTNHRTQNTIHTLPYNRVTSYKSEPGKLTCYQANGKKMIVRSFQKKKFNRLEIKKTIDWINKYQKKLERNRFQKRVQYFSDFIQETEKVQKQDFINVNDPIHKTAFTINLDTLNITFSFEKD